MSGYNLSRDDNLPVVFTNEAWLDGIRLRVGRAFGSAWLYQSCRVGGSGSDSSIGSCGARSDCGIE
eukprot:12410318-Karenia_brevis.AAC.1